MIDFRRAYPLLIVALLLLLSGCRVRQRTQRVYREWGRATLVGFAERGGEIGVAVSADGEQVVTAWFGKEDGRDEQLFVRYFNGAAQQQAKVDLPRGGDQPRQLQLVGNSSQLAALWTVEQERERRLMMHALNWQLAEAEGAATLAGDVRSYRVLPLDIGFLLLIIDDASRLQLMRLDAQLNPTPLFELEEVLNADMQIDSAGVGHLAWSVESSDVQRLRYATFDPQDGTRSITAEGLDLYVGRDASDPTVIGGPNLALEDGLVYVLWNRSINTPVGSFLRIFFTSFVPGVAAERLESTPAQSINIPVGFPPPQQAADGFFPYSELGNLAPGALGNLARPASPAVGLKQQLPETAFALALNLSTRNRGASQPVVVYMRDGQPLGYQPLTWTNFNSGQPAFAADRSAALYVGWIDGRLGEQNPVYLISTSPEWRQTTDRLTGTDYRVVSYEMFNRMLRSVALIFIVLPWLIFPFFWFVLVVFIVSGEMFDPRAPRLMAIGIIGYLLIKYWTGLSGSPALLRSLPNAALIEPRLYSLLVYLIPLIILAVSSGLVWLFYVRRAKDPSPAIWFAAIVILDYVLSLLFYSLGIFE